MRRVLAGLVLAGLLIGCGQDNMTGSAPSISEEAAEGYAGVADMDSAQRAAPPPMAAPAPGSPAPQDQAAAGGGENNAGSPTPQGPAPTLFLAYAYQVALELPADRLGGVMDAHVQACRQAGPRLCQLIGSNRSGDPESYVTGFVSFRGEPTWLNGFMGGLAAEADAAGGRITGQTTSTEDLTRAIVDTEARLRAMRALRDRLQRLLESRPGRLADLLEVERELARVQGEIDATDSNLAVMRTRVAMSELTLNYQSSAQPLRSDTFKPLGDAFANFLGWIVMGFAAIVTMIAVLLPWILLLGGVAWAILALRKRRGGRLLPRKQPPAPAPPANE